MTEDAEKEYSLLDFRTTPDYASTIAALNGGLNINADTGYKLYPTYLAWTLSVAGNDQTNRDPSIRIAMLLVLYAYGAESALPMLNTLLDPDINLIASCMQHYLSSEITDIFSVSEYLTSHPYTEQNLRLWSDYLHTSFKKIPFAAMERDKVSMPHLLAIAKTIVTIEMARMQALSNPEQSDKPTQSEDLAQQKYATLHACLNSLRDINQHADDIEIKNQVVAAIAAARPSVAQHRGWLSSVFSAQSLTQSAQMLDDVKKLFSAFPEPAAPQSQPVP